VPFDIYIGTFKMSNLTKNNLVAQTNRLIEARYTMTKNELLLLFAMVSLINPKDKNFLTLKKYQRRKRAGKNNTSRKKGLPT